jgi:hypothetical protein
VNDVITADKVTGYGDRAVEQGKRVAEVPQQKGKGKTPPPAQVPAHVEAARKLWTQHFAKAWPNVVLHEMGKAPSKAIQGSSFDAWTNSGTQIFLGASANASPAKLYVVLHHEAEHIRQFRKAGKPPVSYTQMMEYEYEAYSASVVETQQGSFPGVKAQEAAATSVRDMFGDKMDDAEAKIADPKARDTEYGRWLVAGGMLPAHTSLPTLYT